MQTAATLALFFSAATFNILLARRYAPRYFIGKHISSCVIRQYNR